MTTLTLTKARANLGRLCEQAKKGEQIGIISGDQILQLKPIEVIPWEETYIYKEYGVTKERAERFTEQMDKKIGEEKRKGKYLRFTGKFDPHNI